MKSLRSCFAVSYITTFAWIGNASAAVVPILYQTHSSGHLESVAIWVAPDPAQSILFVTDKLGSRIELHDPVQNQLLSRFGTTGSGDGQLRYPNGIAVARAHDFGNGTSDVLFVVERDNDRVSMFSLPGMIFRGHFGSGTLDSPYGIALHDTGARLEAWITSVGNDRVYVYDIIASGVNLAASPLRNFGVSATLESIVIDPVALCALICDESGNEILAYNLNGTFLQRFGAGRFTAEPEGITIYDLGNGAGYIVVSDQFASPTQYEVFDRQTYAWLGNFSGPTHTTDGITLTQFALPNCPQGSFFAVNSDDNVHCYRWDDIAAANGWQTRVENGVSALAGATPANAASLRAWPLPLRVGIELRIALQGQGATSVALDVYDVAGRMVTNLLPIRTHNEGASFSWNGLDANRRRVAPGVYFVAAATEARIAPLKVLLVSR